MIECIHACVMILPIEKYELLNQAYLARRRSCQILRRFFSLQEKGITVKLSMGIIESNPLNEWVNTYEWKVKLSSPHGSFFVVVFSSKFFAKSF